MFPLLAAAAALLLLGSGSGSKSATTARVKPKPLASAKPSAKTVSVKIGPAKIIKQGPAKVATPSSMQAPLSKSASQGGGPGLAAPLSADIPADVLPAAPRPVQTPRSQPPGYKPDAARRGSAALSNHLKRAGKAGYDRRMLKTWQTQAGLPADGLYGPATRGALVFYGQKDPPAPFVGSGTVPFTPPR